MTVGNINDFAGNILTHYYEEVVPYATKTAMTASFS